MTLPRVWLLRTDPAPQADLAERWWTLLDVDDRTRAERLLRPADRERSVLAHAFLRCCLSRTRPSVAPAAWRFRRDEHGRPWVAGQGDEGPFFSLSHCRGLTAVLVSEHPRCGVDVERVDATRNPLLVAKRAFTETERRLLESTEEPRRPRVFAQRWVLKEAWSKARGLGMELPFDRAGFEIGDDDRVRVTFLQGIDESADWRFILHQPTDHHLLAVALPSDARGDVEPTWW